MTSRLAHIANEIRDGLRAIGENVLSADDREGTASGILIAYGARALAEHRRPPYVVIVPAESAISPAQSTRLSQQGSTAFAKQADRVLTVTLHVFTPRTGTADTDYEIQDRLLDNIICALRGRLWPTLGAEPFGGEAYPSEDDAGYTEQAERATLSLAVCLPVIQREPATTLLPVAPTPGAGALTTTTIADVEVP